MLLIPSTRPVGFYPRTGSLGPGEDSLPSPPVTLQPEWSQGGRDWLESPHPEARPLCLENQGLPTPSSPRWASSALSGNLGAWGPRGCWLNVDILV